MVQYNQYLCYQAATSLHQLARFCNLPPCAFFDMSATSSRSSGVKIANRGAQAKDRGRAARLLHMAFMDDVNVTSALDVTSLQA